jgi:hypothetical protein
MYVTNYNSCNWVDEARKFSYDDAEKFTWAVIAIQRSIVLKATSVRDEDLGDYITQYGCYLKDDNGYGASSFTFKKSANITGIPKVTFHDVSRWILTADKGSSAKRYAKAWDEAIRLNVSYWRSLDILVWNKFVGAAADAQLGK